jgi:tetratricopeptide (TPR) repeat protein
MELKPLSRDAVPAALEKAMRYRLLNEPGEAESICHDVLATDPDNQEALVLLLLALTDRFGKNYSVGITEAKEILPRIRDPYERAYYSGILAERRAKALLHEDAHGSRPRAYDLLQEAMRFYEQAESLRPPGNDDALLRWNACARIIMRNKLSPAAEERVELPLE